MKLHIVSRAAPGYRLDFKGAWRGGLFWPPEGTDVDVLPTEETPAQPERARNRKIGRGLLREVLADRHLVVHTRKAVGRVVELQAEIARLQAEITTVEAEDAAAVAAAVQGG